VKAPKIGVMLIIYVTHVYDARKEGLRRETEQQAASVVLFPLSGRMKRYGYSLA
jgi:hypothetical protein